jgi:hypothetical protein
LQTQDERQFATVMHIMVDQMPNDESACTDERALSG